MRRHKTKGQTFPTKPWRHGKANCNFSWDGDHKITKLICECFTQRIIQRLYPFLQQFEPCTARETKLQQVFVWERDRIVSEHVLGHTFLGTKPTPHLTRVFIVMSQKTSFRLLVRFETRIYSQCDLNVPLLVRFKSRAPSCEQPTTARRVSPKISQPGIYIKNLLN